MAEDVDSDDDISFGPQSPPLTDQIASVLRRYPDGGQILKELIQNADDASASEVRFLLDPRQHSTENLMEGELARYQGPALYAWNDAVFKKEDWQCLAKIEQSGKEKEVLKVGRFGLGFLSVFHITDLPVVMSKKHVGIADPHQRLQLVRQEGVNRAGKLVKLSEFMEYQGHASSFVGVFDMAAGKSNYDATLFRFPLRQEDSESKISPNCYTPAKVHDNLFSSLQTEAPILLLFLKHVVKVSMYEWNEASEGPVCMFSVEISDNVMQDRVKCTSLAQAYTKSSAKVSVVLTSATTTCYVGEEEPSQYHWLMLNSIRSDLEELRARADETNVLPWVGIAARAPIKFNVTEQIVIDIEDISGVNSIKTVASKLDTILQKHTCEAGGFVDISTTAGQAFCFLPLPGSISLPVNLHGYFAVADNRRSIKWPSHDEKGEEAKWNEILLRKLISPLYALLLICRSSLIQYCGTSIDNPAADAYAAWPVYAEVKNQQIWSEILQPVLTRIVNLPVLWTEACNGTWVTPNEAFFINPDEACPQVALKVLVELGYKVVSLPLEILETMLKNEEMKEIITRRYVTAELVQNAIRNRKGILHSVPKEQVYQLLEYVLSYQPNLNPCVLIGLEVLPLSDNSLCQFTANGYGVSNHVFVFPEKYKHCLEFLPGISSSVVATRIPVGLQEKLEELSKKGQLQLKLVTPDIICGQLIKLSMKSWSLNLDSKCIWKPGQSNHPPMEWIENVWTWIRISKAVQQVCMYSVPIVPKEIVAACTKQVCLLPLNASPGLCTLHRETLPEQCPLDVMLKIVGMVGLLHVQQSDYVSQCPGTDHYIKRCDAQFLLLHIRNKLPSFSKELTSADKDVLRHFIACDFYAKQPSSQETKTIKSLPIFKAGVGGSPSQYLSLNSLNCVLPPPGITFQEDIEYPPYILCDEGGRVTALLEMLKIARSHTVDEFCMSIILPHVTQKARWSDNDEKLVMWVLQLPLTNPKLLESFSIVRPCASGHERKKPNKLYYPSDDVFCNLFDPQSEAAFPANEYKLVLPILRQAGLKTWSGIKNDSEKRVKFFVDRANFVSKLSKSKGLARSKNLLPHLLHMGIIQDSQFSTINFLFPQESPPADYPPKLKWYGKDMPQAMCPQDIYCNTSEACLIGSIVPILSSEYRVQGKHPGFHKITAKDIIRHFWEVVSFVSKTEITESDGDKVHEMVMKIYRSLSNQKSITEFPRQWIWWRNTTTFLTPEQCVFTLPTDIATLEPYLFCLSVNPELQARVSSLLPLLPLQMQLQQSLSNEDAVTVLNKMNLHKGKHLTPEEVSMAVHILQWLKKRDYQTRGDIVIPTTMSTLALVSECTYDDRNWKAHTLLASKYTFVHEDIPPALAKHFRVTPLSQKLAPSKKLQLKYTKAGQHEPITRRIRGLVEGYATSSDIFKELLQNADDAGATEVKFLIDWREHPTTSLLANELQDWQGPALIAYNDSVFSDQDFDHICELAAETKMKDPLKTGRFGVGFCAIYHLTDVPSFISRRYFTMFDPHTSYLGERVSEGQPGMRIDLVENREDLTVCADQFQPYNGLFGCDVFNLSGNGFQGTLFRFPFRSSKTANKSSISGEVNDRRSVERLIQKFREQASYLLLFLKQVHNISVSVLEERAKNLSEMVKIIDVEKTCECLHDCNRVGLVCNESQSVVTKRCHCTVNYKSGQLSRNTSQWIICSAVDHTIVSLSQYKKDKERGLVPFAEVAIKVQQEEKGTLFPLSIEGYTFCFLPLPRKTELPFHVNGFFDISHNRSDLTSSDDERFGKKWNESLCKGPLMQAFIEALSVLAQKSPLQYIPSAENKKKYMDAYYDMFRLSDKKGLIGLNLCSAVKKGLPETDSRLVWSDVRGGEWLRPRDVVLLELALSVKQMLEPTIDVLLEFQYNICQVPNHLVKLLIDFLKKKPQKQVYNYQTFCTKVLMPKIDKLQNELREQHILFLLKNLDSYMWMYSLLKVHCCIPVKACTHLVLPNDLIDDREPLLMALYDPEEGKFPAKCLNNEHVMVSLSQLGMIKKLSIQDIKNRAHTVETIHLEDRAKAAKRSWTLLQYLQKQFISYLTVPRHDKLSEALCIVPFLPAAPKPDGIQVPWCETNSLVSPCQVFTPKYNNLVFSVKPVVKQPDEYQLHPSVLALMGTSQDPPLELVLQHLLNLSQASESFDENALSFIAEVANDIYRYLQRKLTHAARYDLKKLEDDIALAKERLQQSECIWQENKFLKPEQVVLNWHHNCYPYLCELSSDNKKYLELFVLLGVKEQPSVDDLAGILCRMAGQPNSGTEEVQAVPVSVDCEKLAFIEEIVKKMSELITSKNDIKPPQKLYLPDDTCVMHPVKQLACDKVRTDNKDWVQSLDMFTSQFEGGECRFLHPSIPRERAITLGVKPLLDTLIQGLEDDEFLKGTDYGQHEDLCDRLHSILKKYPADYSILNEFIQNADDAQATEVVFLLDHRTFPKERIFPSKRESWKDLQCTPALCVINNRKFTEDDIKGIVQLGRGGKRDSSDTIGKFGIGFNVAYHVTDCPSFVSFSEGREPENFCVLDPTCRFAPNSNKQSPGKRWKLSAQTVADLPEQFQPYLLKDLSKPLLDDSEKGHVVFRLPLTRQSHYSHHCGYSYPSRVTSSVRLSNVTFNTERVSGLLEEMKAYVCDAFLFLNHVTKISALEIKENGEIVKYFSTRASMSPEDTKKCHAFARKVKEKQTESTEVTKTVVLHEVPDDSTNVPKKEWLICRKYAPITDVRQDGEDTEPTDSGVEWNMRPLGGVAAAMGEAKIHGRFFCFLPMPLESNLPVHVNGHFLVDDSRKHLENLKKGHLSWNETLAVKVIAPCYVELLLHAQRMTESKETDPEWFYSLFPCINSQGEVGNLKMAEEVYKILLVKNPSILLQRHPDTGVMKWFCLKGIDRGYFFKDFLSEDTKKEVTADPKLKCRLIRLGMPITTEVSCALYDRMSKVDSEYSTLAMVDPQKILKHMKKLSLSHIQAIMNNATVQLLLQFLIDGMRVADLKEALKTVPLLLSYNGRLWKGKHLFKSAHALLLPHCSAYFVHQELEESSVGKILTGESYEVIIDLPVDFVAKHIDLSDVRQAIRTSEIPPETVELIEHLWMYLLTGLPASLFLLLKDVIWQYLRYKPLLPTDDGHLYPMCLSDAIVCSDGGNHHIKSTLKKLGYPTLSFKSLKVNDPPVCLVNICSDGNWIISCFMSNPPPRDDADLSNEEVRAIIDNIRHHKLSAVVVAILRNLKIFETADGKFISMKGNPCVYVMPQAIPRNGIGCIQMHTTCVILNGTDELTMKFYRTVVPNISAANMLQFYKEVIIPHLHELRVKALQTHLKYIHFTEDLNKDSSVMRALGRAKLIKLQEGLYSIAEVCDPDNIFFVNFCSNRLLPDLWKAQKEEWLPFFKELGLRHELSFMEWLKHAKLFAADHRQLPTHSVIAKSNALLDTLIDEESSFTTENLKEASTVAFIYNGCTPALIDLVNWVFRRSCPQNLLKKDLFCFQGSVMHDESDLAALCRNVLPKHCKEKLSRNISNPLGIELPVQATTVEMNLKKLSEMYTCLQRSHSTGMLREVLVAHYAALDKTRNLQHSGVDIAGLRETLCIAVSPDESQTLVLVRPSQLVMSLPADIDMAPFRYKVPHDTSPYTHFLEALDVPKELSASSCADILYSIHQQLKKIDGKLSNDDKYKKVALNAYNHMVCTLRKQNEDLPRDVYLPSEDDNLVLNSELLYNDAMWYALRLPKGEVFQFVKLPPPDAKGEKVPPASLGVKRLTSVVSEELHEDMFSQDLSCTHEERYAINTSYPRCQYVKKVQDTLVSPQLQEGLRRVYFSECKEKPSEQFETAVAELLQVDIKCVTSPTVFTVLKKDGAVIPDSECRNKYCHASGKMLVLAPHGQFNKLEFMENLSSAVRVLLRNEIKNEAHIMAMFQCDPSEIEAELDKHEVSRYDPTTIKETKFREVGETIPLQNLCLANCLVILNFSVGEKVCYYDSSGVITIAEVTAVQNSENLWENTVILKVKCESPDDDLEERKVVSSVKVSPLFIFKLLTPSQQILLFCEQSESASVRDTAEPVHLAEIPSEEEKITEFLSSPFFHGLSQVERTITVMRLIVHLHYTQADENSCNLLLKESAAAFLQKLTQFLDSCDFSEVAGQILSIAANLLIPLQTYSYGLGNVCQASPIRASSPQSQRAQPSIYHHQPRFQPRQRRGYQSVQRYRFQPEQPTQEPPPPPTSEENAQIWLDQAKTDYRAAFFLMRAITVTPTVVPTPQACEITVPICDIVEEEEQDSDHSTHSLKGTEHRELEMVISEDAGSLSDDNFGSIRGEEEGARGNLMEQSSPQFPALVCFLCHEAVEKCIKGVMYAYCGLKPDLINCSTLVSLYEDMKRSPHRPQSLMQPIEQCVMQINEHENKSRLPNYQIPLCAPASAYTAVNANEAFLAARQLFESVQGDQRIASMLGDLGDLPKPRFTSVLRSLAGNNEYPPYWESHRDDEEFQILPLDDESDEFQSVAERFLSTLTNADIRRIDRIQNRVLWRKYIDKSREMCQFGEGVLNEQLLFHGSRTNNPELIYKGDASFDMRFSHDGLWGHGNYFAVNASYSNSYAFTSVMLHKKMLAAWVLTGRSFHSEQHNSFTYPPYLDSGADVAQGGVRRRHDSVNGTIGGSKVYITYDNTLAYPAYLITYTV